MTFWDRVDVREPDECWPWTGALSRGYGHTQWMGRVQQAHRIAWGLTHATNPPLLDHICHNGTGCSGGESCPHRRCCNPAHLIPKTQRENLLASPLTLAARNAAKTHCPANHPYDDENTYVDAKGLRHCRECGRKRAREYQRRKRQM